MLIIALVLAVIGLAALVTAVVTSNEVIAWVCIGASVIGVLLLIVDALRERSKGARSPDADETDEQTAVLAESEPAEDYPDEPTSQFSQASDETDTAEYPDDVSYPDESDTTAVVVDDDEPIDEPVDAPSDADDSTKRD